jgi:acyl-CoA reductase-like NAD-dependent aldehyde dehydrogenase
MISGKSTALVDDVRIKGVSLTGSEGMEQVWQQPQVLKKICSIRTWGSDSFIVLEDADIDKTIESNKGRMNNNGQVVLSKIYRRRSYRR